MLRLIWIQWELLGDFGAREIWVFGVVSGDLGPQKAFAQIATLGGHFGPEKRYFHPQSLIPCGRLPSPLASPPPSPGSPPPPCRPGLPLPLPRAEKKKKISETSAKHLSATSLYRRRRTNVQQLTCKINLSSSFYFLFFSFVLIEPFVLKGKVLGEKL